MEKIYNEIIKNIAKDRILLNEPMCRHTSFKIGGPADIFIIINDIKELKFVLRISKDKKIPLTIIGNGTNILVRDNGIRGITVKLNLRNIDIKDEKIEVDSGYPVPLLAKEAYNNSLSGLEFASGIPGTVGGAIKMNAGAYGGEFKDIIISTIYINENLEINTIDNKKHQFDYRNSIFQSTNDIILSAQIQLKKCIKEEIKNKMQENALKRTTKQPLNFPNAGSIFKRKKEYIVAEIIDKCGLKGYNINDAYVSELHSGFIINKGNATAKDVLELIEHIKTTVKEKYLIDLELEIKILGE